MYIYVNTIDIRNYNIGFLKGQSLYTSMCFTMLFVIFIIPREIPKKDVQYVKCPSFYMYVLFFKFPTNDPISEFST